MTSFATARRQQFLSEDYFKAYEKLALRDIAHWSSNLPANGGSVEQRRALAASDVARDTLQLMTLRYTAGHDPLALRVELAGVVAAYERYASARRAEMSDPAEPPFLFAEISHYERCQQVIGLCYLLHRRDLLPAIAAMQDPAYAGDDTLYEDLLAFELDGRIDVDEWFHDKPYRDLINGLYRDDKAESLADLKKYLKGWYPAMKKAPWHDSHLNIQGNDGSYFGYWAFEAGAVALLLDLDDSTVDHMVYPRDLVAWARQNIHLAERDATGTTRLRCAAGQPCPRPGLWFTPARVDSRQRFEAGQVMPQVGGDYGATIWQWDEHQSG